MFGQTLADDRLKDDERETLLAALRTPTPERIFQLKHALVAGVDVETIAERSGIDPWFLCQLADLLEAEREWAGAAGSGPERAGADGDQRALLRKMKRLGFSDRQLGDLIGVMEGEIRAAATRVGHPAGLQDGGHVRR